MKKIKELKYTDLKNDCPLSAFKFKTSNELETYNGIIGQERALEAVKTAMQIYQKGFNLYVCGNVGMGKTAYVLSVVNKLAKSQKIPNDICYIYNFDNPNEPLALSLPVGQGRMLKEDMNKFITAIRNELLKSFGSSDVEKEKKVIVSEYEQKKNEIMKKFDEYTTSEGFKIKTTETGIYFSPIYNGNVLNEQEFNALDASIKKSFEEKSPKIQAETMEVMKKIEMLDKECTIKVSEWQANFTTYIVSKNINNLKLKYKDNLKLQNFLFNVQSDIVKNIEHFKPKATTPNMVPLPNQIRLEQRPWEKYRVNLLVNNENLKQAPVVVCTNPSYYDLFGKLEYENQMGSLKTDHTMLKAGLMHKANGGYLLINARDLMCNMTLWEAFKRVLRNNEITIDSSRDMTSGSTIISLKPELIPLNLQVVLIGSESIYMQLSNVDSDFKKLFKVKADFDDSIPRTPTNVQRTAEYVAYVVKKDSLLPFKREAIKEIVEYSSRCAGDKRKLTAMQVDLTDIIIEASFVANKAGKKLVDAEHVKGAIKNRITRYAKYDENLKEMIKNGTVILKTDGEAIGQINGLTIINTGDATFGKPVLITANTYLGNSGVINIEREVSMSGTTHSKGVYILASYIGQKFAQDIPLSLTASLCFEQLYNGVDGDSASSTELYAILSSLSGVPIKQGIAVTGSVNQKGEIQPIGGVTEKIEGFFEICKYQGLTGNQGVIIPYQNVANLALSDEIIDAVKDGLFHIYPVATIDEGIEILTGVSSGKYKEETESYEKGSINYLVHQKLKHYAEKAREYIK